MHSTSISPTVGQPKNAGMSNISNPRVSPCQLYDTPVGSTTVLSPNKRSNLPKNRPPVCKSGAMACTKQLNPTKYESLAFLKDCGWLVS